MLLSSCYYSNDEYKELINGYMYIRESKHGITITKPTLHGTISTICTVMEYKEYNTLIHATIIENESCSSRDENGTLVYAVISKESIKYFSILDESIEHIINNDE